jgi:hypothetical protein
VDFLQARKLQRHFIHIESSYNMRVTIYQPQYFPRLHYFNRILDADIFVILASAQYTKGLVHITQAGKERHSSYQSDTPIKTAQGIYSLTVPIKHNGYLPINHTEIDNLQPWKQKHLLTLTTNYKKAAQFNEIFPSIEYILKQQYTFLADLTIASILWGLYVLLDPYPTNETVSLEEINILLQKNTSFRLKKIIIDTEIGVKRPEGSQKGTEWTTAICQALHATEYFHGGTAQASYMDEVYYANHGITLIEQKWQCPPYDQLFHKEGFFANLSIIDLLMNVLPDTARTILRGKTTKGIYEHLTTL